jgi:Ca2+-binding RTX toxin-like protein
MRLLLAVLSVALLASGSAHAATVVHTYAPGDGKYFAGEDSFTVVGDDADDQLTATIGRDGIDLADTTAPLTVSGLDTICTAVDEHHVRCGNAQGANSLWIDGGAGADRLTVVRAPGWTGTNVRLNGGPGDDDLTGSDGRDVLVGGPGRDVIRGMGGDDSLNEIALESAPPLDDGDVYDGGEGTDTLTVAGTGLAADLAAGTVTGPGLTVALTSVEAVMTGPGSVAAGTDGVDVLSGGRLLDGRGGDDWIKWTTGDDGQVLRGGEGDDRIEYGPHDDVEGGPGDDVVTAMGWPGGRAHAINCGPGEDVVDPYGNDAPGPDCEWVANSVFRMANAVRAVAHGSALRLTAVSPRPGCGVVASATQPGVRAALTPEVRVHRAVRAGVPFTVTLPLRSSGRRLLAHGQLRAPRVYIGRARSCPAHGRWWIDAPPGRRLRLAR